MMALVLVLLTPLLNAQQNIVIRQAMFVPPEYYVGDQVELRLLVEADNPEALMVPAQLPLHEFIDFRRIDIVRSGGQLWVVITFVSYASGERVLPILQLGGGSISGISISTKSILGSEQELRPYLDPLPLPNTAATVALLLFLVLGVPVLGFYGIKWMNRAYLVMREIYRRLIPHRQLMGRLEHLKKNVHRISAREFYEGLNEAIRKWILALSRDPKLSSLTANEMRLVISRYLPVEGMVWVDLLNRCERFIYSGAENLPEAREDDLERAISSLREMSEHARHKKAVVT